MSRRNNNERKPLPGWVYIMTYLILAVAAVTLAVLATGCSPKLTPSINDNEYHEHRDSTAWRDSLLHVPVPEGKDHAIVSSRDTSHLETSVAESTAYVDSTGRLHHTLTNKPTSIPYQVKIPVRYIFNGVVHSRVETLTKYVKVEKPLSWWQSLKIGAFWWLLAGLILCLAYIFRKPLFAFIKTLLKIV